MVTTLVVVAEVGVKNAIVGTGFLKLNPGNMAEPLGVLILTFPLAPLPTMAVILESLLTLKEAAGVSPKLTEVAPVKFVPVMVIDVPVVPSCGLNEEIEGTRFLKLNPG